MISEKQRNVDAMLATACSHLLQAGELAHQMRALQREGSTERYWHTAERVAEHLALVNHCFHEAHAIRLAEIGLQLPTQMQGGLVH
jgi:esterase/lipase superfamily enzyme